MNHHRLPIGQNIRLGCKLRPTRLPLADTTGKQRETDSLARR
ncbi:UNVERIFIED_ORG: hypothetical protein QOE_3742 [Clostridioides difficile F501]